MTDYETWQKAKLLSERDRMTVTQISRELGLSRPTVMRILSDAAYRPRKYARRASKLDPFRETIRRHLERHRYTVAQILRMIREDGYRGGKSILRDYVSMVRPPERAAFLTLQFAPGEAAQADFGCCGTISSGESRMRLYVFVMTLCHSRMLYAEFVMRQNMEHFLQCHRNAFEFFGAVPRKVMVDNCRTAVETPSLYGDPVVNRRYADLAAHYGFKVAVCGVRKPHEKGRVERGIGYLRQSFLNGLEIGTLESLNCAVRTWMSDVANARIHGTTRKRPDEMFKEDRAAMGPLPLLPYDCSAALTCRASRQCRIVFETNRYSVPPELAGATVGLSVWPEKLAVTHGGRTVAEHRRSYERNTDVADPEHAKALLEKRRMAGDGQIMARFLASGETAARYYRGLCERRLKPITHVRKIMALSDTYGGEGVKLAMEDAMRFDAYSAECVLNILDARSRPLPEPGPLHLTRKSDCLDIEIGQADLGIYENIK